MTPEQAAAVVRERIAGPYKGLSTRTAIAVYFANGDHLVERGLDISHAMRRAALRIELVNAVGPLEQTDPKRRALRALTNCIRVMMKARGRAAGRDAVELGASIALAREVTEDLTRSIGWDIDELGDPPLSTFDFDLVHTTSSRMEADDG